MPTVVMTDEEIRRVAKARAGFKVHLLVYLVINVFLASIWFVTMTLAGEELTWRTYWPIFPHLGWGVAIAIHGFATYSAGGDWVKAEEERLRARYGRQSP